MSGAWSSPVTHHPRDSQSASTLVQMTIYSSRMFRSILTPQPRDSCTPLALHHPPHRMPLSPSMSYLIPCLDAGSSHLATKLTPYPPAPSKAPPFPPNPFPRTRSTSSTSRCVTADVHPSGRKSLCPRGAPAAPIPADPPRPPLPPATSAFVTMMGARDPGVGSFSAFEPRT